MEMSHQLHNPADLPRGKQRTFKLHYSELDVVQGSRGVMSGTVLAFVCGDRGLK